MISEQKTLELEMLLCMEIKIRLLETEGITIPTEPPPIPEPPHNFNFAYNVWHISILWGVQSDVLRESTRFVNIHQEDHKQFTILKWNLTLTQQGFL